MLMLWRWALKGYPELGHCRKLQGTSGVFWALWSRTGAAGRETTGLARQRNSGAEKL